MGQNQQTPSKMKVVLLYCFVLICSAQRRPKCSDGRRPECSDGSTPQRIVGCSDGRRPSCGGSPPVCPDGSSVNTDSFPPCSGGRPECTDGTRPLCADGNRPGRGGRRGGR